MDNQRLSKMFSGHDVGFLEIEGEGFERHGEVVAEVEFAKAEKFGFGGDAADVMEELPGGFDAEADVIQIFFHFLNVRGFPDVRRADGFIEGADVIEHVETGGDKEGFAALMLADLVEEPGIADDAATDHKAARAGELEDFAGLARGIDVAVGEDGARNGLDGAGDVIVMDFAAVHFADGAAVDGEEVERMAREDGKEFVEDRGRIKAESGLDGELDGDGVAEGAEDGVHTAGFAEESAAGAFAIDDGRGATEVQVDGSDGISLQLGGGANEGGDVVADHLRDGGFAGGIFGDGFENPFFEMGHGVDAEIFGVIDVRTAVGRHEFPEREVGDILHRRERENGLRAGKELLELGVIIHCFFGRVQILAKTISGPVFRRRKAR